MLASKSSECEELWAEVKMLRDMIDSLQRAEVDEFTLLEEMALLEEGKLVDLEKECTELRCKVSEEIRAKNALRSYCDELSEELNKEIYVMKGEILTLITDVTDEGEKKKQLSLEIENLKSQVLIVTENRDREAKPVSEFKTKLQEQGQKEAELEARKIEDDKSCLEMYNKPQAMWGMCNGADSIQTKYNQLHTEFQTVKESLEKEIIRRKYVENVAKVFPKTYNPTTMEDFMKGCETDHTDYLNRLKNTYKDVGLVCQICEEQLKIDPNSLRYVSRDEVPQSPSAASGDKSSKSSRYPGGTAESKIPLLLKKPGQSEGECIQQ